MQAMTDIAVVVLAGLIVIAIAGDELARFVGAVALPLCALVALLILARLVWFYTSRW
jgi:hypothetical protein